MIKKISVALIIMMAVSFYSCGERNKYVLSEVVEIEYWGDIEEGEWIMIDDLKFYHATNDTSTCDISYVHGYLEVNEAAKDDRLYLPTTEYFACVEEGKFTTSKLVGGDLAVNLISALNEYAEYDEESLELPYKNTSGVYYTTIGKLILEKTNGQKIKVSTSKNYKAAVRKVTPQN
ncbi:MAG TPA: hypothetical protein VIN11_05165 [Roseivirga sp.]